MTSMIIVRVFAASIFFVGVSTLEWTPLSPANEHVIYACTGSDVTLRWTYGGAGGQDGVTSIDWLYDGHSSEMIAIYTHGTFVQLPAFSHRVQFVDNAGLKLLGVTKGDAGNYTVELNGFSGGSTVKLQSSVTLIIADDLQTADGFLHAIKTPTPILDPTTGQYRIQLQCGLFTYINTPPFQIEWQTPGGDVYNSTDYADHYFSFVVPSPVETGNYTCRINHNSSHDTCLPHGGHDDPRKERASVFLDGVEVRVTLLEAQQLQLLQENKNLKMENEMLKADVHANVSRLDSHVNALEDCCSFQNATVAFYAYHLATGDGAISGRFQINEVGLNVGNAFDATTGIFTVPLNGYYFLAFSSGSVSGSHSFYVVVDGNSMNYAYAVSQASQTTSLQKAMKLNRGQRVWVEGSGRFGGGYTSFSGFLIARL